MSVVVVGGGVLGFMHALEARRRGHPVTHLEREPGPRGASVRNFGLIWVSGRGLQVTARTRRGGPSPEYTCGRIAYGRGRRPPQGERPGERCRGG